MNQLEKEKIEEMLQYILEQSDSLTDTKEWIEQLLKMVKTC